MDRPLGRRPSALLSPSTIPVSALETRAVMPWVVIDKVSKTFPDRRREVRALDRIELSVAERELLVLVGPSGSGKTTLLRLIAGLDQASSGSISIGGVDVTHIPPQDRGVAMIFQEHSLYPHMTVRANLAFGLELRKVPRAEIGRRVNEAAAFLGLEPLLERRPDALSGGERQRTALGRSLVLRPRVFLLDEPLSQLDAPLRAQMRREITRVHRELGTTMIYVTHDQAEAMTLGDRIAVIRGGVIEQTGKPLELYRNPNNLFVASFFGAPPLNLFAGTIEFKSGRRVFRWQPERGVAQGPNTLWDLPEAGCEALADGESVVLGLRPEHLRLLAPGEPNRPGEVAIPSRIEGVEPMGWETHVWLRSGGLEFSVRLVGSTPAPQPETECAALDLTQALLFDGRSGSRIERL